MHHKNDVSGNPYDYIIHIALIATSRGSLITSFQPPLAFTALDSIRDIGMVQTRRMYNCLSTSHMTLPTQTKSLFKRPAFLFECFKIGKTHLVSKKASQNTCVVAKVSFFFSLHKCSTKLMLTVFRQSDATATVFFCCLFLCWYYLGVVSSTHSLPVLLLAVSYNTNGHWLALPQ